MTRIRVAGYFGIVMKGFPHTSAFVVQFRGSAKAREGQLEGRVEHVASGRTANFQSIEELPQLLLDMLRTASSEENGIG